MSKKVVAVTVPDENSQPNEKKALLIFDGSFANTSELKRRNMPRLVKPGDVPIGGVISGVIVDIVDSPVSTVKGKLLWLRHESGIEYTFPVTGVIRNALAPGCKGDDNELGTKLKEEVGKTLVAKRLENSPSKYKREMFMFDVFTSVS